jgi:hypothetical protein
MKNPIPHSNLFATPVLEDVQRFINTLPAKEQANANLVFMFTLNAAHKMVEDAIELNEIHKELGLTV